MDSETQESAVWAYAMELAAPHCARGWDSVGRLWGVCSVGLSAPGGVCGGGVLGSLVSPLAISLLERSWRSSCAVSTFSGWPAILLCPNHFSFLMCFFLLQ